MFKNDALFLLTYISNRKVLEKADCVNKQAIELTVVLRKCIGNYDYD